MAAKKPTADERIENMQTVVEGYKRQLAEAETDIERYRKERNDLATTCREWKARAEGLEKEVGNLREELHAITVEKARLEGYIDRARQFDPEPEPIMVTVPESMVRQPRNGHRELFPGEAMELERYGSKDRPQPWYKRDV